MKNQEMTLQVFNEGELTCVLVYKLCQPITWQVAYNQRVTNHNICEVER